MRDKFKIIRNRLGMTQKEFSDLLGIKQSYYSSIERGEKRASTNVINALIKMGVPANWIYSDSEDELPVLNISTENFSHTSKEISTGIVHKMSTNKDNANNPNSVIVDYHGGNQQMTAYWNSINKLHIQNNCDNLITPMSDVEEMFFKAYSITGHYGLVNQTSDLFEKYYTKQIDKEKFEKEYQKAFQKAKELNDIIREYRNILNEISDKLNQYNRQHDNIKIDTLIGL